MHITRPGDAWTIGCHKLLCGDATDRNTVARLMADEKADLCFTSPPYLHQRKYIAGVGDWDALMRGVFGNLPMHRDGQVLVNLGLVHRKGEVQIYWHDWQGWMRASGWNTFGWYVWDKGHGMPGDWGGRLAPTFEFLFHFNRMAKKPHKTKAKQPCSIRYYTGKGILRTPDGDVCTVRNRNTFLGTHKVPDDVIRVARDKARGIARLHPATFPVQLSTEIITAYTDLGQLVYEPFAGSGTTIIGAHETGRRCYAVELQPEYCDLAIRRIQQATGLVAVHSQTKRWFQVPDWLELVGHPTTVHNASANENVGMAAVA